MSPAEKVIEFRRALHQIPEVGLDLPMTRAYLWLRLTGLGLKPVECAEGLYVDLGTEGPLFAWRADMDALPIQEELVSDFISGTPGKMHACGHDAHMAIALGIAQHYTTYGHLLPCRLRIIFQPGEEGHRGAKRMIEAGVLEGVQAISGLHIGSIFDSLPLGSFGTCNRETMAACSLFSITYYGNSGHGSKPPASNALLAACDFASGWKEAGGKPVSGYDQIVSIGSIHSGDAPNVIPGSATLTGSIRAANQRDLERLCDYVKDYAKGITWRAKNYGTTVSC